MEADGTWVWRSLLYVPAHIERYVEKACGAGADAVILDLEDSVPLGEKDRAREQVGKAADRLSQAGMGVVVRINRELRRAVRDVEAVVRPSVRAVAVPKVESAAHVRLLSEAVAELEREQGMAEGSVRFIALIESPEALGQLDGIARSDPRLVALILGTEDFASATGMDPDGEGLLHAKIHLVFAARAAGLVPLGLAGSVANYKDLERLRSAARRARSLGFEGATCVHPVQVPIVNEAFTPGPEEVQRAERLMAVYKEAVGQGRGAVEFEGRMVDAPMVHRAARLLERHRWIARRMAGSSGAAPACAEGVVAGP